MPFPHALHIADSAAAAADLAAGLLAAEIAAEPRAVIGFATGGTMAGVYAGLLARWQRGEVGLSGITGFNLDEYLGLPASDPASYAAEMRRVFYGPAGIPATQAHIPDGAAPDPAAEADRYEAAIASAGGIDCQLLGIGANGHIGFNEPGSGPGSRTRVVTLAPETIAANARHFPPGRTVPQQAISMGIATILSARRILLLATGEAKAEAVRLTLRGPPSPACPASFLGLHPHVTVVLDAAAAALLGPTATA